MLLSLVLLPAVFAWNTLYSFEEGLIYLHLSNNDLVALNFSATGLDTLSKYTLDEVNYKNGQSVQPLAPPPANSSLFVWSKNLYAFLSSVEEELAEYDVCGEGVFQLLKYDRENDRWAHEGNNMTFAGIDDISFYADATYLTSPESSTVYIYGGRCGLRISSRLLLFDMHDMHFSNISTSTKPQGFYGAGSAWAPSPQQTFVVGGRSALGWLNMGQIAQWDFVLGWLSQQVANSSGVGSRTGALVLPVFKPLSALSALAAEYSVSELVVLGGETSLGPADWARLRYSANLWTYLPYGSSPEVLGAAVVYNTIVAVQSGSTKRDAGYTLSMYGVQDLAEASDVSYAAPPTGRKVKVLVGTLVPLFALVSVLGAAVFLWRRRKAAQDQHSLAEPLEYQFGHYKSDLECSREKPLLLHINDSASTLSVRSMDLWVRKRQEYDMSHNLHPNLGLISELPEGRLRPSYLASNETLLDPHHREEVGERENQENREENRERYNQENREREGQGIRSDNGPQESPFADPSPARIAQLKKSFSYSHTPPQLPMLRKKTRLDPGSHDLGHDLDDSLDENVEVQVLVSSKRKSVLRVANPDTDDVRQRVSSRESKIEE